MPQMLPEREVESIARGDGDAKSPTGHVAFDDVHFVEPIQPDDKTLVRLYRELLVPNFCSDQLATEEAFVVDQRSEGSRTILAWDSKGDLVGGLTGHYYATRGVYLLGYLAVSPLFRGKGIGSALLSYGLDRWSQELAPTLMLGEVEDPRQHNNTRFGDPQRRFNLYRRFGARALQLPYFQPALRTGGARVRGLLLMVFAARADAYASPTTITGQLLDCFLRQYVLECEGHLPENDAALRLLLSCCRPTHGVPLLPLGALPSAPH
jgi:GNAT superfamily N-acetyltransferase